MSGTGVRLVRPGGLVAVPEVPAVRGEVPAVRGVFFVDPPAAWAAWAALAALAALTCPRFMVFQARRWASCGPKAAPRRPPVTRDTGVSRVPAVRRSGPRVGSAAIIRRRCPAARTPAPAPTVVRVVAR